MKNVMSSVVTSYLLLATAYLAYVHFRIPKKLLA
jgi:hypothetical protein